MTTRESPLVSLDLYRVHRPELETAILLLERPFGHMLILRGCDINSKVYGQVESILGFSLPIEPNTTRSSFGCVVLWLGPSEWFFLVQDDEMAETLPHRILTEGESSMIMIEVSGGYTTIELQGKKVAEALSALCPLDLHDSVFKAGSCAQSLLGRIPAILYRPVVDLEKDSEDIFQIIVRRSFAAFLWEVLFDVCKEFGVRNREST